MNGNMEGHLGRTADNYDQFSPHLHAGKWKTPMLIIHGELDYRVPVSEGMQAFNVLQRKGIASKWLYFPDENHWVLKPGNSELWHKTVFEWLKETINAVGAGASRWWSEARLDRVPAFADQTRLIIFLSRKI